MVRFNKDVDSYKKYKASGLDDRLTQLLDVVLSEKGKGLGASKVTKSELFLYMSKNRENRTVVGDIVSYMKDISINDKYEALLKNKNTSAFISFFPFIVSVKDMSMSSDTAPFLCV